MALVREEIFRAASSGSIVGFSRLQMSTSTGFAPQWITVAAVATNVIDGQRTSSPGPMPSALSARNSAAVPFETATASAVPVRFANAFSNACVRGPAVIQAESRALRTSLGSRSSNSSSDSRAFHIGFQKRTLHLRKIFIGLLIIVGPPDIHPVGLAFIRQYWLLVCQKALDKLREIEFLRARNVFTHGRRENIDPHADQVIEVWFFFVIDDLAVRPSFNDTELDRFLASFRSDGCDCTIFVMEPNDLCKVHGREEIAI